MDEMGAEQPEAEILAAIWEFQSQESLPKEFRYLRHYLIGKRRVAAAMQGVATDSAPTEGDRIRYRMSQHAKDAYEHLVRATNLSPDFSPIYQQLFHHHRLSGNWADALLTSNTLVKLMPRRAEALAMRAECYRVLGQPDSARQDLEAANELLPTNCDLHYRLGKLLVEFGEYDDAIESYEKALASDAPHLHDKVHYDLAVAYRKAGNMTKAISEFTTAKALGRSAHMCDSQIAACRLRQDTPAAGSDVSSLTHELAVYVTKSGTKYHCEDCKYLNKSNLPIALSHAVGIYEPCSHCRPPALENTDRGSVSVFISQQDNERN
jgi:tetratricopeptide (TPR) repeat protein